MELVCLLSIFIVYEPPVVWVLSLVCIFCCWFLAILLVLSKITVRSYRKCRSSRANLGQCVLFLTQFCIYAFLWAIFLLYRSGDIQKNPGPLTMLSLNVNSLWSIDKRNEFRLLLNTIGYPDVLALQETKLDEDFLTCELMLDDYTVFRRDRNRFGGGVLVAVKKQFCASRPNLDFDSEGIAISLQAFGWTMDIVSFYRPSHTSRYSVADLDLHLPFFSRRSSPNRFLVVAGDFNMSDFDPTCALHQLSVQSRELLNVMGTNGLQNIVDTPRRKFKFLDLVFVTTGVLCSVEEIAPFSDHSGSIVTFDLPAPPDAPMEQVFRQWRCADWNRAMDVINHVVSAHDLTTKTVGELMSILHDTHERVLDQCVPVCHNKQRKWRAPWAIQKEINLKMRLHKAYKQHIHTVNHLIQIRNVCMGHLAMIGLVRSQVQSGCEVFFSTRLVAELARVHLAYNAFKRQRSLVKSMLRVHARQELRRKGEEIRSAPKKIWKYVNRFRKRDSDLPTLLDNAISYTSSFEKAELLARTFARVFVDEPPLDHSSVLLQPPIENEIGNISFTVVGVQRLLEKIDLSKAAGPDGISSTVLKNCASALAPLVTALFNASITSGHVPDEWRLATVMPIPKKGASQNPSDYRPISLTSILCKKFEHILVGHLFHHFDEFNILMSNQHGFRKHRSCETALVSTFQKWADPLDQNRTIDALMLDFSKAFDKVPHERLIFKLKMLGITGTCLVWIKNFLARRSFTVTVDGVHSSPHSVTSGVPQGSVLGPILFLCYINDISFGLSIQRPLYPDDISGMTLYADDIILFRAIDVNPDSNIVLQSDLDHIVEWCSFWCLELNPRKCCHLRLALVGTKAQLDYNYHINQERIERVVSSKYLGVTVSENFRWHAHISAVRAKASSVIGLLRRNFSKADTETKLLLYKSLVRPVLEFGASAWDPYFDCDINSLEGVQNKATRFVLNAYSFDLSVTALKNRLKLPTLAERRRNARVKLLTKYFTNEACLEGFPDIVFPSCGPTPSYCRFRRLEGKNSFLPRTLDDLELQDLCLEAIPFDTG